MSYSWKMFTCAAVSAAVIGFSGAAGAADTRDVVMDARGNIVHSTNGNCVYTKWDSGRDNCGAPAAPREVTKADGKRSFLVFFDWDKSNITMAAKDILSKVADKAGNSSIVVTGHADRSGSDAYNMGLSERRARSVRDALKKLGFDGGKIKINWKGERDPLVSTADGMREPQNRRAEITIR